MKLYEAISGLNACYGGSLGFYLGKPVDFKPGIYWAYDVKLTVVAQLSFESRGADAGETISGWYTFGESITRRLRWTMSVDCRTSFP